MNKSLYNSTNWRYTHDGEELDKLAYYAISKIFQQFLDKGYSPREISHIIQANVSEIELEEVILKNS